MQELKSEMNDRIDTLERRIERRKAERVDLLQQVAECEQQIEDEVKLAAQYRQALGQLNVSLTYAGAYAAPTP